MLRFSLLCAALATLTATGCHSTSSYRAAYPAPPGCCPAPTARAAVVVPAAPCPPGAPCANGQIPPPPPPRF
ncbi:MAG: hypothetical protein L0Y71_04385 [Gemmataceae bacterium]|nr:hypothetical protein [Gemmataceae bacterium]